MPDCTIVGAGQMGTAICYAMSKLGYKVHLRDISVTALNNAVEKLNKLSVPIDIAVIKDNIYSLVGPIVISASPYTANLKIAKAAIQAGYIYCDLGGDPDTSDKIAKIKNEYNVPVATDLGLAPGLINILAHQLMKQRKFIPQSIMMYVGGLPINPSGSLNYGTSWSYDGLYNQYTGKCRILRNHEQVEVDALSEPECPKGFTYTLESFHTKGGSAHSIEYFQKMGVTNCEYRTLRFTGHRWLIDFLLNECKVTKKEFKELLMRAAPPTTKDRVYLGVDIDTDAVYRASVDCDEYWTAMQKCTAYPTAAVADMIYNNEISSKYVTYNDIDLKNLRSKIYSIDKTMKI